MIVWVICVCGAALVFDLIGIYAMRRKAPMWFWSGTEVGVERIADVPAYNRANGIMWLLYSLFFWIAGVLGVAFPIAGLIVLGIACTAGMAALVVGYRWIYRKYCA